MGTLSGTGQSQGDVYQFQSDTVSKMNDIMDTIIALLEKLDADAGITDTDYEALFTQGGSDADALPTDLSLSV